MASFDPTRRGFIKTSGLATASLALSPSFKPLDKSVMAAEIDSVLHNMEFKKAQDGWGWPKQLEPDFEKVAGGLLFRARGKKELSILGPGVHTRAVLYLALG